MIELAFIDRYGGREWQTMASDVVMLLSSLNRVGGTGDEKQMNLVSNQGCVLLELVAHRSFKSSLMLFNLCRLM